MHDRSNKTKYKIQITVQQGTTKKLLLFFLLVFYRILLCLNYPKKSVQNLAVRLDNATAAAVQEIGVKSSRTAARPVAIKSLIRESNGIPAAALTRITSAGGLLHRAIAVSGRVEIAFTVSIAIVVNDSSGDQGG